jgi:MFS family permease
VYLVAAPLAFSTAWAWPGLFNLAVVRANPSNPASATGITQTGQFIGAVVGPVLFGIVAEHAGFRAAWLTAGAIAGQSATALVLATTRLRKS